MMSRGYTFSRSTSQSPATRLSGARTRVGPQSPRVIVLPLLHCQRDPLRAFQGKGASPWLSRSVTMLGQLGDGALLQEMFLRAIMEQIQPSSSGGVQHERRRGPRGDAAIAVRPWGNTRLRVVSRARPRRAQGQPGRPVVPPRRVLGPGQGAGRGEPGARRVRGCRRGGCECAKYGRSGVRPVVAVMPGLPPTVPRCAAAVDRGEGFGGCPCACCDRMLAYPLGRNVDTVGIPPWLKTGLNRLCATHSGYLLAWLVADGSGRR